MDALEQPSSSERPMPEQRMDTAEAGLEQLQLLRRKAQAEASRREFWCNSCGRAFQLTPTEILQHKRTHASS